MNVDDRLRRAADRLNVELEQVPVPYVPQRTKQPWRTILIAAVVTIVVGGSVLWVTRGGNGQQLAPGEPLPVTSTTLDLLDLGPGEQPQPIGPVVAIAEGTFEGSNEAWQLTTFVSESDGLCMGLFGGMGCGPVPSALSPFSAFGTTDHLAEPRLSCAYGAVHSDVAEVVLTFTDNTVLTPPIHSGDDLPASFYAYCWAGNPDIASVAALDANGDALAVTSNGNPPGATPSPCPVFDFDSAALKLELAISLDIDTVRAGSTFSGTVTFTNPGEDTVYFPYNGSTIQALLFAPGTDTPVAVYTEPVTSAADALEVPPEGTATLSLVGGTAPCGPNAPDELPAGTYDVRFALLTGLSDPVPLVVTD